MVITITTIPFDNCITNCDWLLRTTWSKLLCLRGRLVGQPDSPTPTVKTLNTSLWASYFTVALAKKVCLPLELAGAQATAAHPWERTWREVHVQSVVPQNLSLAYSAIIIQCTVSSLHCLYPWTGDCHKHCTNLTKSSLLCSWWKWLNLPSTHSVSGSRSGLSTKQV